MQDPKGQPIPGFTLDECPEIIGDQIERTVAWKGGSDLGLPLRQGGADARGPEGRRPLFHPVPLTR